MKYHKTILLAIWKTLPLTLFTIFFFFIIYMTGIYVILAFNIVFISLIIIGILDDYLDYIEIGEEYLTYRDKQGVFGEKIENIQYNNISKASIQETFWKRLFGFGDVILTVESKSQVIENVSGYRQCVIQINNKIGK